MSAEHTDVELLAKLIAAELRRDPDELWSVREIAQHVKTSESSVYQRYLPLPDFPKAIRLKTAEGKMSRPRWEAREVKEWFRAHKERN